MSLFDKFFKREEEPSIKDIFDKEKIKENFKELIDENITGKENYDKIIEQFTNKFLSQLERVYESINDSTDNIQILEEQIQGLTSDIFRYSSRRKLCKLIKEFVRNYPEVYNSLKLIASYIVYGSSDISIEEYKVYPLSLNQETPKEDVERANLLIQKFESETKIKKYMFKIAMDLLECQDAFMEIIRNKEGKIVNIKYLPTETIEIELNRFGTPKKYIQIIDLDEIPKYVDNDEISQYDELRFEEKENIDNPYLQVEFNPKEILHFNDGSKIGVSDNPLLSMVITWKFLRMVEESLIIHRITRARRFIVYFLDVTGKTKERARLHIKSFTNKLKKIFSIDLSQASLLGKNSIVKTALDLVIPVTKDSATKIQTIPADTSATHIEDLKFYLNRILTNLMTSWIFYPERTGKEEIQKEGMIRMVKIYQKQMSYTLSEFYEEFLKERNLKNISVEVIFPNPDSEAEIKLTDVAVRRMMLLSQLSAIVGTSLPVDYILEFVFKDFSTNEVRQLINIIKETQRKAENPELGSLFGAEQSHNDMLNYNVGNNNNVDLTQFLDIFNKSGSIVKDINYESVKENIQNNNLLNPEILKLLLKDKK
jgi:hypothetical protein